MSDGAHTADRVIAIVRDMVSGPGPRPIVTGLQLGEAARGLIGEAAGWGSAHSKRPLTALYGVEVFPGRSAEPLGWRLVGANGAVIIEGTVSP